MRWHRKGRMGGDSSSGNAHTDSCGCVNCDFLVTVIISNDDRGFNNENQVQVTSSLQCCSHRRLLKCTSTSLPSAGRTRWRLQGPPQVCFIHRLAPDCQGPPESTLDIRVTSGSTGGVTASAAGVLNSLHILGQGWNLGSHLIQEMRSTWVGAGSTWL